NKQPDLRNSPPAWLSKRKNQQIYGVCGLPSDKLNRKFNSMRSRGNASGICFVLQQLEDRVLLSVTPAQVLTPAIRQNLLNNLNLANKSTVQADLNANNMAAFDAALLTDMQTRTDAHFFFDPSDVPGDVSYITTHLNYSDVLSRANAVVSNYYPEQDSSQTYT